MLVHPEIRKGASEQRGSTTLARLHTTADLVASQRIIRPHALRMQWQGWPSGESTCLPPMWSGFDFRTRRHTWIEFVGSLLCYERFSPGFSGFPLSPKTNI